MQKLSLSDLILIVVAVTIAAFIVHQFFPKIKTRETTSTVFVHDTTTVTLKEVKYVRVPMAVHDTIAAGIETITARVDTTFPDSAVLHARSTVQLPAKIAWLDFDYTPAPQKVITLEKIVTREVTKTEIKPDLAWTLGGVAVGVIGGIWIAHQVGK